MDMLQLVLEAFLRSPILFVVPAMLIAFVIWSPWSPPQFYHRHDHHDDGHDGFFSLHPGDSVEA
jgi:hypothetical protein